MLLVQRVRSIHPFDALRNFLEDPGVRHGGIGHYGHTVALQFVREQKTRESPPDINLPVLTLGERRSEAITHRRRAGHHGRAAVAR
jgi:hypothetical protein